MSRQKPTVRLPLYPSAADQWLVCPGAPRVNYLGQLLPEPPKPYADEGSRAHEYLEALLTAPSNNASEISDKMKKLCRSRFPKMIPADCDLIEAVADQVWFHKKLGGYELIVEKKFPLDLAGNSLNAKIDILLVNATALFIIDFKWGAGVAVSAYKNKQLTLYALAASVEYPKRRVFVGIHQPRGVGKGYATWEIPQSDMMRAMIEYTAAAAKAYEPIVEYVSGPHCRWCAGLTGLCPKQLSNVIDATVHAMDGPRPPKQPTMPWWILDCAEELRALIKGVSDRADFELKSGRPVPGWSLIAKDGKSKWIDPEEVHLELQNIFGGPEEDFYKTKTAPITITEARKLVSTKKQRETLQGLIEKPPRIVRVKSSETTGPLVPSIE